MSTIFICQKCDAQFPKWSGRCLECGAWGSLVQTSIDEKKDKGVKALDVSGKIKSLNQISGQGFERLSTNISQLDEVLGGGIVPGSLILLGGEPGIGKSTLVLQIVNRHPAFALADARAMAGKQGNEETLYISGEESAEQIKMRMDRLGFKGDNLQFLSETNIEGIVGTIEKNKPILAIIDSIQTVYSSEVPSAAGSLNQVRVCTTKLLETAKKTNVPIILIGHVTKEGAVAGPKTLEHLVDTVLYFEGDRYQSLRILRTVKNRFGSTNQVGVFEMTERGLVEVANPSQLFLANKQKNIPGSVITCVLEGTRPFLIEVQALVSKTNFGYPQRRANGFDLNRLQLLTAVLTQRARLPLNNYDIYLNIAGGFKVSEPAADLAVCLAVASALKEKCIDEKTVALGEVGLGGEIRSVNQLEKRLAEVSKLGFDQVILPVQKLGSEKIRVSTVKSLEEALGVLEI